MYSESPSPSPDAVDLLIQVDKLLNSFPRPPRHHAVKACEIAPESEMFPLSLNEVTHQRCDSGRRRHPAKQVQDFEGAELGDGQLLIRPSRSGHSPRMAESVDKQSEQPALGIPIPGSTARSRGQQHRRSCGLDMDSDAVLEELAASEGGGFNKIGSAMSHLCSHRANDDWLQRAALAKSSLLIWAYGLHAWIGQSTTAATVTLHPRKLVYADQQANEAAHVGNPRTKNR